MCSSSLKLKLPCSSSAFIVVFANGTPFDGEIGKEVCVWSIEKTIAKSLFGPDSKSWNIPCHQRKLKEDG
ncbi:unnamed protein product [Trifolium pratense]|uniref:Uncharacterized protein n=1 Tax=Trifolium pratense TaxID=57577 RepID=A0ACB0L557_TRIPR|nr:unnamed protein product [Trifolium pratense]